MQSLFSFRFNKKNLGILINLKFIVFILRFILALGPKFDSEFI